MEKKYVLELVIFVATVIVIVGAVRTLLANTEGPTNLEILRSKLELMEKTKSFTFGASLPQEYFRCETERLYWFEDNKEDLSKKLLQKGYGSWYAYGEGKIDFASEWAGNYFSSEENPACYVCAVVTNSHSLSGDWSDYLIGSKNQYWTKDERFRPWYFYDGKHEGPILSGAETYLQPDDHLEISPNKPVYIGASIWKTRPEYFDGPKFVWVRPSFSPVDLPIPLSAIKFALFSPLKKGTIVLIPFVMNSDSLNRFCKEEIFIDVQ